ncbi:MAG TPA: hypothetical protein VFS83_15610, partial [Ktedonobacterales bacterium]|nr:hypothetical protein [Ktedonobacterales bacterium]
QRVLEAVAEVMSTRAATTATESDEHDGDDARAFSQYAYAPDDEESPQTELLMAQPAVPEAEPVTPALDAGQAAR